jgi:hypothetical protein
MGGNMSKGVAALLALTLVGFALGTGVQSSAAGQKDWQYIRASGDGGPNRQKQQAERLKILQDQGAPKGSTGPTAPPKPTQGNTHK